jgi:nucleoside-diphosphate kinase
MQSFKATDYTLMIIKPDTYGERKTVMYFLDRYGIEFAFGSSWHFSQVEVEHLYAEHMDQPYFPEHCAYMTEGMSYVTMLRWATPRDVSLIDAFRSKILGATDPKNADPNTLRGMFASKQGLPRNGFHGSDSLDSLKRELKIMYGGRVILNECAALW